MIAESLIAALDRPINDRIIKTFRTKKDAEQAGKKFGWRCAIKIERRFGNVWVVGKKDFEPSYTAGIAHDNYRFPLLFWEKSDTGITFCPVVKIQIKSK